MSVLPDAPYQLGIRPRDLRLVSEGGMGVRLSFSEISGSETFLYVDSALGELAVQMEGIHDFPIGTQLRVAFAADRFLVFAIDGQLMAYAAGGRHG